MKSVVCGGFLVAALALAGGAAAPAAGSAPTVQLQATIDNAQVGASTEARPIRLSPRRQSTLSIEVTNDGPGALDIRIVRLEGKVVGLPFFAYDTAVGLKVAPGETGSRRFLLDLGGLDGQATGLIPGSVKLLDANRHVVAEQGGVVDVRGSLRSVYGIFGLGVAVLTAVSFLGALLGLARHRLPVNRWRRALRFLTPGLGVGLLLNFTLSATRVFVPTSGRWLAMTAGSAAMFFGLGYLTPQPDTDDDAEDDDVLAALPAPFAAAELPAPFPAPVELPAPFPAPVELAPATALTDLALAPAQVELSPAPVEVSVPIETAVPAPVETVETAPSADLPAEGAVEFAEPVEPIAPVEAVVEASAPATVVFPVEASAPATVVFPVVAAVIGGDPPDDDPPDGEPMETEARA